MIRFSNIVSSNTKNTIDQEPTVSQQMKLAFTDSTDCYDLGLDCPNGGYVSDVFKVDDSDALVCLAEETVNGKTWASIFIGWGDGYCVAELQSQLSMDMALLALMGLGLETTEAQLVKLGFEISKEGA